MAKWQNALVVNINFREMEISEKPKILISFFLNTFITKKTHLLFILKPSKEKEVIVYG